MPLTKWSYCQESLQMREGAQNRLITQMFMLEGSYNQRGYNREQLQPKVLINEGVLSNGPSKN